MRGRGIPYYPLGFSLIETFNVSIYTLLWYLSSLCDGSHERKGERETPSYGMPQIFHPSTNAFAKVSIFGAVFFIAGLAVALTAVFRSPYNTNVDVSIEQPVQFSHEHHVGGLGIDCRYCHTSVEVSAFADIPPTHTCMTCHSQIWSDSPALEPVRESFRTGMPIEWTRVHDLADFTYFNHQIHVNKGVGCETCHGRVDQMPLMRKAETLYMEWCLECHRAPEEHLRPLEEIYTLGYVPEENQRIVGNRLLEEYDTPSAYELTDCTTCHR